MRQSGHHQTDPCGWQESQKVTKPVCRLRCSRSTWWVTCPQLTRSIIQMSCSRVGHSSKLSPQNYLLSDRQPRALKQDRGRGRYKIRQVVNPFPRQQVTKDSGSALKLLSSQRVSGS